MDRLNFLILQWYESNKRNLPWRNTKNPYFVWLSEIILQQTRVDQGLPYYEKFIAHYPTIFDLAKASEKNILKDWQGLGYYSRARNLHHTAKKIVQSYHGIFPSTFDEILSLKGIGRYTAAAIASFCFDEQIAVLDGNVYRLLSRIFDIDLPVNVSKNQGEFEKIANEFLDKKNPGNFNQAIMEFGALQCKPVSPNCSSCPLRIYCLSYKNETVATRPVKLKKQKIKKRFFIYWVLEKDGNVLLRRRLENDIWKMMYEFPSSEFPNQKEQENFVSRFSQFPQKTFKHILSHQHITAAFIVIEDDSGISFPDANWISSESISDFPMHRLMTRYLEQSNH
ncbi:MAG: A/G-specific adenine glycosylase [Bacteroidetes bacterium]|nr:A/G-specific adenine glycosylase [Bacteroidota bacterium]